MFSRVHTYQYPENWNELVTKVDIFISEHGDTINKEDYRSDVIDLK